VTRRGEHSRANGTLDEQHHRPHVSGIVQELRIPGVERGVRSIEGDVNRTE
jgi:hypothetical protein